MIKELKERRTTSHHKEDVNKETEIAKRSQVEILELKSTITRGVQQQI